MYGMADQELQFPAQAGLTPVFRFRVIGSAVHFYLERLVQIPRGEGLNELNHRFHLGRGIVRVVLQTFVSFAGIVIHLAQLTALHETEEMIKVMPDVTSNGRIVAIGMRLDILAGC